MMGVLNEHATFWIRHDTSGIPDHLLGMMLLLRDSTVLVSSRADALRRTDAASHFLRAQTRSDLFPRPQCPMQRAF
jgi:predicted transcriptional regulator